MKKVTEQNQCPLKAGIITFLILTPAAVLFLVPVRLTVFESYYAQKMQPFGPVYGANALNFCLPQMQNVGGFDTVEFFLATYNRINNNKNILTISDGQREIRSVEFNSADVKDNAWFRLPMESTKAGIACLTLSSADGTPENAVTVWLNRFGNPVFRLSKTVPLYRALPVIWQKNIFSLPRGLVFGLFLAYIVGGLAVLTVLYNSLKNGRSKQT